MAPLLEVSDLRTHFTSFGGSRVIKAVDGVSFTLNEGETLGLIGESGCGKTTTCLSIVGLLPPAARIASGRIVFAGEDLTEKTQRQMRRIRGRSIAMILQDPMASLNPLFSIYTQVAEPAYHHQDIRGRSLRQRVQDLLRSVRIPSPAMRMRDYPHQMSGGMRQRIVGAIALAGGPKLIIADEPTTNLDVTIQAQYLDLLKDLQQDTGVAIIFVTHNLGIVARMCDRMAVMYAGKIVEQGSVQVCSMRRNILTPRRYLVRCRSSAARSRYTPFQANRPISRVCRRAARSIHVAPRPCRFARSTNRRRHNSGLVGRHDAGAQPSRRKRHMTEPVLEVHGLRKYFPVSTGSLLHRKIAWVRAVKSVDFTILPGETLGLIGESGCGKTTTAKLILLQEKPTAGAIVSRARMSCR